MVCALTTCKYLVICYLKECLEHKSADFLRHREFADVYANVLSTDQKCLHVCNVADLANKVPGKSAHSND